MITHDMMHIVRVSCHRRQDPHGTIYKFYLRRRNFAEKEEEGRKEGPRPLLGSSIYIYIIVMQAGQFKSYQEIFENEEEEFHYFNFRAPDTGVDHRSSRV